MNEAEFNAQVFGYTFEHAYTYMLEQFLIVRGLLGDLY